MHHIGETEECSRLTGPDDLGTYVVMKILHGLGPDVASKALEMFSLFLVNLQL